MTTESPTPDSHTVADQAWLDTIFPASRTDAFFEALFGGAEEGAYDIRLVFERQHDSTLEMAFQLHQRPGQCLRCNLTYGLPDVFARHPILNIKETAGTLAKALGWEQFSWRLGRTQEESDTLHTIPFILTKEA